MSSNKTDLLASLTGETPPAASSTSGENGGGDQDLFGDIPITDTNQDAADGLLFGTISLENNHTDASLPQETSNNPLQVVENSAPPTTSVANTAAPQPAPTANTSSSLLAGSGLLGTDAATAPDSNGLFGESNGSNGGGLFDAVDEELEQKQQEEAQRLAREQQEQEALRLAQQQEQERAAQETILAQQMQQQQQAQQQQPQPVFSPSGFYRNHTAPQAQQPQQQPQYNGNLQYSSQGGLVQTHSVNVRRPPTTTAGMHASSNIHITPPTRTITAPTPTSSPFGSIQVQDPMLVASSSFLGVMSTPPHWTYQITTTLTEGGTWLVRRRFRHVPALEERLRLACPGSILPPRPEKHATRAIEEASTSQSAEFALARAEEMQIYLEALAQHPIACHANELRLFLALQDDLGTAWPEVSSNTLTRLSAVGAGAAVVLAESTLSNALPKSSTEVYEEDAELLALQSSEELRMGAVTQAVPKLQGSLTLLKEHGEGSGAVGMELSKFCKEMELVDVELAQPLGILSSGLLKSGRREKRLALELSAALSSFVMQYKLCKNERLAFSDRRTALQKCQKERSKADERAQRLLLNPSGDADVVERNAVMSDTLAMETVRQAQEIGVTLKTEVNRVAHGRRTEWYKSMKVVASAMTLAGSQQVAIWESTQESFLQAFPDMAADSGGSVASGQTS